MTRVSDGPLVADLTSPEALDIADEVRMWVMRIGFESFSPATNFGLLADVDRFLTEPHDGAEPELQPSQHRRVKGNPAIGVCQVPICPRFRWTDTNPVCFAHHCRMRTLKGTVEDLYAEDYRFKTELS